MINILISGTVIVKNLPEFYLKKIIADLTFKNPIYHESVKRGRWIPSNVKPTIELWRTVGPNIRVPRGYMNRLLYHIQRLEHEIIDNSVAPEFEMKFTGTLRDYQSAAVADCLNHRYGILEASTGSGKTIMAMDYISKRNTTAIILVHSKELLDQWHSRLGSFTDLGKIGSIGGGLVDIKPVTVGIINSAHKIAKDIRDEFGTIIFDECHRAMGTMWIYTMNTLRPRYQLGLSATPFRSDGLTSGLYRQIGPKLHKVDSKRLEHSGAVLAPRVCRVQTNFNYWYDGTINYSRMMASLVVNIERNAEILKAIVHDITKRKQPVMVVSDRVSHCDYLFLKLLEYGRGIKPVLVHGRQPKETRSKNIDKLRRGEANILVATTSLLGEGFDAPNLYAIFLTTPIKFDGRVLQTIGRILRPEDGKVPRVYDFRDNRIECLRFSGFARDRVYKKKGWTV